MVNNAWQPVSYGGMCVVYLPDWNSSCDGTFYVFVWLKVKSWPFHMFYFLFNLLIVSHLSFSCFFLCLRFSSRFSFPLAVSLSLFSSHIFFSICVHLPLNNNQHNSPLPHTTTDTSSSCSHSLPLPLVSSPEILFPFVLPQCASLNASTRQKC